MTPSLSRPQARLADDLFALDPRIRYVALLDRNHKLVESRMRTSVASFTPESYDRKFMGSVPPLILEKGYAKPVDIAKNLHVTPPTVTGMLNKLREEQFIVHEKYGGIVLTEK